MWWNSGPHLRRRMLVESGMGDSYRMSQSFFSRCSAVDEFKDVLVSKFGTLSRAWRVLDIDGSGKMDMREFCQALNRMGYVGNIRTLWHLLDSTNAGSISLEELDPRAAAALEKFRVVSLQHHDSIEHMWKNIFDIERTNAVNLKLFIQGCHALGYEDEMEAEELFHQLLLKSAGQHLALEDLQFLQNWEETKRRKLERRRLGLRWVNRDPFLTSQVLDPSRSSNTTEYSEQVSMDMEKEVRHFREYLSKTFGSLPQAFEEMDANKTLGVESSHWILDSLHLSSHSLGFYDTPALVCNFWSCGHEVEFQSVVANLLRYCRHGEARRLFRALIGEGELGRLTWQELGISKVEWTAYRMQKSMEARRQKTEAILNARAPLGASPRMKHAESHHVERIREKKSAGKFVFNSPLPPGWGPPPDFVPLEPPASRVAQISLNTASGENL
ncbi:unnamed protein product [Symbiodinium necroappetens]|uniref:EF-hand domain-containing protein n=1 Tax=Symbiodinium necroappetens TaxID=1628268 RepID=A0A812QGV1_9DINO|nr:unnamed protein product [Symbiodinium necroappetens]